MTGPPSQQANQEAQTDDVSIEIHSFEERTGFPSEPQVGYINSDQSVQILSPDPGSSDDKQVESRTWQVVSVLGKIVAGCFFLYLIVILIAHFFVLMDRLFSGDNTTSSQLPQLISSPVWNDSMTPLPILPLSTLEITTEQSSTTDSFMSTTLPNLDNMTIATTDGPVVNITIDPAQRRSEPQPEIFNKLFFQKLSSNLGKVHLDLSYALQFCNDDSILHQDPPHLDKIVNCTKLNWPLINEKLNYSVMVNTLNMSADNDSQTSGRENCFEAQTQITCFHPFNTTHTKVGINLLEYHSGTLDMESVPNATHYVRRIFPMSPEKFLLLTGNQPDEFCMLDLSNPECVPYQKMILHSI